MRSKKIVKKADGDYTGGIVTNEYVMEKLSSSWLKYAL
jgi:hypothetical protein